MPVRLETASKRAAARVGSVIKDKWTLDRLIGVGGMAAVYAATHRNKKRAAIKMLHPELSLDPVIRDRFLREGYAANSVGHSGAVAVDDDDVAEDGCAYIVMELLDGETIEQRWERKHRRLPPQEVLSITDQLLDTLIHAHQKGVVHRDIKPENMFLTRDGSVKVLDFGIARLNELSGPGTNTQTGNTMGTPAFMAPEQARGRWEEVDERTDLWAVGATMFTLLTGEFVHEGETVNETLALAVTQPARSLKELRPDLDQALIELVDRALIYEKAGRWPDAATMQEALRHVYLQVCGKDVSVAPQLSVPDVGTSGQMSVVIVPDAGTPLSLANSPDPRALTTARGLTASGSPGALREVLSRRRVAWVGAILAALVGAVLLWAKWSGDSGNPGAAAAAPSAALTSPVGVAPPPSASAPRAVKVEELPQEKTKAGSLTKAPRAGAKSTATPAGSPTKRVKDDPFARRR